MLRKSLEKILRGNKIVLHAFFMSNTFISNIRLKLAKSQAKANQHPESENYQPKR